MGHWHKRCDGKPFAPSEHHRKAVCHGGTDGKDNVIHVTRMEHAAFNCLFGNGAATAGSIATAVNGYAAFLLPRVRQSAHSIGWCGKKANRRKVEAWQILFDTHPLSMVVHYLNRTWIDPAYRLVIKRSEGRQKVFVEKK